MSYEAWVGKLEDGTEILVMLEFEADSDGCEYIDTMAVASRSHRQHTWGPPTTLERAP